MHSSWETSSRLIPTRYETDFYRHSSPRWELAPFQPMSYTPPFPTTFSTFAPPPAPEFSRSLVHYPPPRESGQSLEMEREMRRMNEEMGRMMDNMKVMNPISNIDDWRLTENFRMENPIQSYGDGSRKFSLQFDLRQFKPEEIQVRTSGNQLTVSARHEDKDAGKAVFREYNRSYVLPKDVAPERLTSKLSTGGVLTIEAPLPALEGPREKLIPIKHN
ncbi:body wall muscle protein HR-29-like [Dreissena polymorpha]|uniref:body wall muscle protein HR-29-like n=1 Tax=Dreissena polymorpha TaxID=45954 RepID=UPI002264C2CF|nr:body wall muscle protein HR-29-like [Dreissena polymorpha]